MMVPKLLLLIFYVSTAKLIQARLVPRSPCPKLFNYYESQTHEVFGAMTFDNDLSGHYELEVQMSIAMKTDKNLRIIRRTPKHKIQNGEKLEYYILFPYNHTFPKLTSVRFQGKLYCVGSPEQENKSTPLLNTDVLNIEVINNLKKTPQAEPDIKITINNYLERKKDNGNNIEIIYSVNSDLQSDNEKFPWLVAIFELAKNGGYIFRCAGYLISNEYIITAAKCVTHPDMTVFPKEDLVVVLGKNNIRNWARHSTLREVENIYIHPDYVKTGDADLAVLHLNNPVQYGSNIKPILFWDEADNLELIVGQRGTMVGWGRDKNDSDFVYEPSELEIPIVSQEDCLRSHIKFTKLSSTFCAGPKYGDSCNFDGGEGFVMKKSDGKYYLRGVVSFGLHGKSTSTCEIKNYIIFSDISKYIPWIRIIT